MVENTLGTGENAGYKHFLLFPKCYRKPESFPSILKVGIVLYLEKIIVWEKFDDPEKGGIGKHCVKRRKCW